MIGLIQFPSSSFIMKNHSNQSMKEVFICLIQYYPILLVTSVVTVGQLGLVVVVNIRKNSACHSKLTLQAKLIKEARSLTPNKAALDWFDFVKNVQC